MTPPRNAEPATAATVAGSSTDHNSKTRLPDVGQPAPPRQDPPPQPLNDGTREAVDRDILRRGRDAVRDYCEAQLRGAAAAYGDVPAVAACKQKIRDHHRAVIAYLDAKPLEAHERLRSPRGRQVDLGAIGGAL